jgi:hypothetical protein
LKGKANAEAEASRALKFEMQNDEKPVVRKVSFFKFILLPFLAISIFSQFYANAFLMAFLVDNHAAVELVKQKPGADMMEIMELIEDSHIFSSRGRGKIQISEKNGKMQTQVSGEFWAAGLRILLLILLYFWVRPFLVYIRSGKEEFKGRAVKIYNSFYRGIFTYFLVIHLLWFFSNTLQNLGSGKLFAAIIYHLAWLVIEKSGPVQIKGKSAPASVYKLIAMNEKHV